MELIRVHRKSSSRRKIYWRDGSIQSRTDRLPHQEVASIRGICLRQYWIVRRNIGIESTTEADLSYSATDDTQGDALIDIGTAVSA